MARYIDAELFMMELVEGVYNGNITGPSDVEKLLNSLPTADVKEVVRGKWEIGEFGHKCSVCNEYMNDETFEYGHKS